MSTIQVTGQAHKVQADSKTPLLHVLQNELLLKGPKYGCGLGQCGACTVHAPHWPRPQPYLGPLSNNSFCNTCNKGVFESACTLCGWPLT